MSDTVEITVALHQRTHRAALVSKPGAQVEDRAWLALREVEIHPLTDGSAGLAVVVAPVSLARERGLL